MGASSFLASFYLVCGIIIFFLAVMIVRQSSKSAASWFTALVLLFASSGPILGAMSYLLAAQPREGTLLFKNLVDSFDYVWEFFFPSLVLFALVYPRRHRWWPWVRKIAWMLFLPHVFHLILLIFLVDRVNPSHVFQGSGQIDGPFAAANLIFERSVDFINIILSLLFKAHHQMFAIVDVACAAFSMVLLVGAIRSDMPPRVKRQVRVLLMGLGLCIVTFVFAGLAPALAGAEARRDIATGLINAALIIGGGSIAFAIVRYQLLDMRLIARRGILYVAAAAVSASIYLLVIKEITSLFARFSGGDVEILETGFIILFIIAFQPVLGRIEDWSERFLVREQHSPRARIRSLSGELLTVIDVPAMKQRISDVLADVFEAKDAHLVVAAEAIEESHGDPDVRTVFDTLAGIGEPVTRSDLLEALGFLSARKNYRQSKRKKHADEIAATLPAGMRRFADCDLLVPITHDSECVAAILLGSRPEQDRYSAEERALLSMLAAQVAASLHNIALLKEVVEKRVMEEELNIARSIQLKLLPSEPPELERFEVAALSVSSKQVGGDYYDFLRRGPYLAVAVADVSGKGFPASLLMATLQASLRSNLDRMERPVELVGKLNDMMCEATTEDKFATLFYGCLDMERNLLMYTNAGHVFPTYIGSGGRVETLSYSGLILGVLPGFGYEHHQRSLEPGDMLVVVSDGVTEATDDAGEFYGEERLSALLSSLHGRRACDVRDGIIGSVNEFSGPKGAGDDVTILVLRRKK